MSHLGPKAWRAGREWSFERAQRTPRSPNLYRIPRIVTLVCWLSCVCWVGCQPRSDSEGEGAASDRPARPIVSSLPQPPATPPAAESWDTHWILGKRLGSRHTERFELDDQRQLWREVDQLQVQRFGDVVSQQLTAMEVLQPDGAVSQIGYELVSGDSRRTMRGLVKDGQLWIDREMDGRRVAESLPWTDPAAGFFAVARSLQRQPLQPGEQREVQLLVPLFDSRLVTMHLQAEDWESVTSDGEPAAELLRIVGRVELDQGRSDTQILWCDRAGTILRTRWNTLDQELRRTTAEQAQLPSEALELDLGRAVGIAIDSGGRDLVEEPRVTYRVEMTGVDPAEVFPVSAGQQLRKLSDFAAEITVERVADDGPAATVAADGAPVPGDSRPTELITCDDRRVIAMARAAVRAHDQSAASRARAIEQYVHRSLHEIDFSQIFSSAAEVVETRNGDCSEHAVLVAACCRAVEIPARVVVGLVYSDDDRAFLYHMWSEAWIGDRWLPLDATLSSGVQGGHLKIADTNLEQASVYSLIVPVLRILGKARLELVPPTATE